jgi:tight adherence protein C
VDVFLVQMLAFFAMFLLVFGVRTAFVVRRVAAAEELPKPGLFETFKHEIAAIGSMLEPTVNRAFPRETERIKNRLIVAALADRLVVTDIRGLQGLLAASGFLISWVTVFMINFNLAAAVLTGLGLGLVGWLYPTYLWLARVAANRQEAISRALPYAIDLLTVAMQAGQDFGAAVRLLVNEGPPGPLRQEFGLMLRQTELGKSRVEALKDLSGRVQLDEMRSLVTAVVQSTEMGSSVAETLKLQADEVRRTRYHKAERKAARAPSIMLIPIALFILPAVFIVIFTPVFLRIASVLAPAPQ